MFKSLGLSHSLTIKGYWEWYRENPPEPIRKGGIIPTHWLSLSLPYRYTGNKIFIKNGFMHELFKKSEIFVLNC